MTSRCLPAGWRSTWRRLVDRSKPLWALVVLDAWHRSVAAARRR